MAERENCPMRHENGNCLPCGGFCLAVNDLICEAMHNAYYKGFRNAVVERKKPEPQKELCIFWHPGEHTGRQRCEQEVWYACACNGDRDKCGRLGKI